MGLKASDLTLNQRFEIIAGWIEFSEWKQRQHDHLVHIPRDRKEYIEDAAKKFGVHEDTIRLVMLEGICV